MLLYNATIDGPYFGVFLFSKGEYKEKAVHVSFIVTFHITSCWAVQVFSVFHHTFMGLCTFMTFLFIYLFSKECSPNWVFKSLKQKKKKSQNVGSKMWNIIHLTWHLVIRSTICQALQRMFAMSFIHSALVPIHCTWGLGTLSLCLRAVLLKAIQSLFWIFKIFLLLPPHSFFISPGLLIKMLNGTL